MKYFDYILGGIRKFYKWGYVDIKAENLADCFSSEEIMQVIEKFDKLDLGVDDKDLLANVKIKFKERKK